MPEIWVGKLTGFFVNFGMWAIVEADLDGTYVMTDANIDKSKRVKHLDKFVDDLRKLV